MGISPAGILKRRTGKNSWAPAFSVLALLHVGISVPGGHPHDSSDFSVVVKSMAPPSPVCVTLGKWLTFSEL